MAVVAQIEGVKCPIITFLCLGITAVVIGSRVVLYRILMIFITNKCSLQKCHKCNIGISRLGSTILQRNKDNAARFQNLHSRTRTPGMHYSGNILEAVLFPLENTALPSWNFADMRDMLLLNSSLYTYIWKEKTAAICLSRDFVTHLWRMEFASIKC